MLILRKPWTEQPPPTLLDAASGTGDVAAVFRPLNAAHWYTQGAVSSSTYVGITATATRAGVALACAGNAGDGVVHTLSQQPNRTSYAVAVMFQQRASNTFQTICGLNAILQVRVSETNTLQILSEGNALLSESTYAGFVSGTIHTVVCVMRPGGPISAWANGRLITSYASGLDISNLTKDLHLGRRGQGTSQPLTGDIIEAALWSGKTPDDSAAAYISADYFGALFEPRRTHIPLSTGAAAALPTLSAATYVPGSLTATGFRPRVTATY